MPRVHKVERARKAIPSAGIAVGDTYYHWTFRNRYGKGSRMVSKTYPKRSQLTRSPYLSTLYDLQEAAANLTIGPEMEGEVDDIKSQLEELGQSQRDAYDNIPENFQQGDTAQMLEERADGCDSAVSDLDSIDWTSWEEDEEKTAELRKELDDEDADPVNAEGVSESDYYEERRDEVTAALDSVPS